MTWIEANRAVRLGEELRNLRKARAALVEDRQSIITVKVEDLTRNYGIDKTRIAFPYTKARLLDVLQEEEIRLLNGLSDLGVEPPA